MPSISHADCQDRLSSHFDRVGRFLEQKSRRKALGGYAIGLLSDIERKSVEPMAALICAEPELCRAVTEKLLHLMGDSEWDDRGWLQALKLAHAEQQETLLSYVAEVLHQGECVSRFDKAIERAVESVSPEKKAVIDALQALRGGAKLTAVAIMTEVGTFQRFRKPTELRGYTGLVPSEYSSGGKESKGRITRTGNAHRRHVLGENACHTRHKPWLSNRLKQVLPTLPPGVAEIAWKAQERLHRKFTKMT